MVIARMARSYTAGVARSYIAGTARSYRDRGHGPLLLYSF
jgi:hypothetical protein